MIFSSSSSQYHISLSSRRTPEPGGADIQNWGGGGLSFRDKVELERVCSMKGTGIEIEQHLGISQPNLSGNIC